MLALLPIKVLLELVAHIVLTDTCVLLSQVVVKFEMEWSHRREFLEHFGEQLLRVTLDLLLLGRQLLQLAAGEEDRLEMLQDQVLVVIRRLK